jgi:hypothetical protein
MEDKDLNDSKFSYARHLKPETSKVHKLSLT